MIICPNCARENEDHYKFCLGCGTEISKSSAAPARPVATALPQAAPATPAPVIRAATPRPVVSPSTRVVHIAAVASPPPREPTPAPVAAAEPDDEGPTKDVVPAQTDETPFPDAAIAPTIAVSAESVHAALAAQAEEVLSTDPGAAAVRPSDAPDASVSDEGDLPFDLSTDGGPESPEVAALMAQAAAGAAVDPEEPTGGPAELPDPLADATPAHDLDSHLCRSCGAVVPQGFRFCGVCGTRYEATESPGAARFVPHLGEEEAPARLIVIHPDGTEGESFPLGTSETLVGRSHPSPLFADDPFLSPRHAAFYFVKGQLFVRDEDSLNGVFLRIKAEVELFHGDMFRAGQQLLMFEEMRQVRPVLPGAGDGTTVMGSPVRGAWGRLSSVVAVGTSAAVWVLRRPAEALGRERGEILFPEDGFVSGSHCRLSQRDGRFFLVDLGSTNGTYLRIKGEGILAQGDLLLLGQQLFKVDLLA